MIRTLAEEGPTDDYLFGPTPEHRRRFAADYADFFKRYAQGAASRAAYADLERMNAEIDVRGILQSIRVPTLVMNRVADRVAHPEAARQLAAAIDGARYLEFPGEIHGVFAVDTRCWRRSRSSSPETAPRDKLTGYSRPFCSLTSREQQRRRLHWATVAGPSCWRANSRPRGAPAAV